MDRKPLSGSAWSPKHGSPSSGPFLSPERKEGETAREATWLISPEAELAQARKDGTALSPSFFLRAPVQTVLALLGASLLAWSVEAAFAATFQGAWIVMVLGVAAFSILSIPLVCRWERLQDAARVAERAIESEFWPNVGRLVSIIVRQGDAPTGEDTGMLWFEDGRLYFSGYRTSFGLFPSQVRGRAELRDEVAGVRHNVELTMERDTPAGPLRLSLAHCVPSHTDRTVKHAQLKSELDRWLESDVAGEGQWPPTSLGPRVASINRLFVGAVAWSLFPAVVASLAILLVAPELATFAFFGTAFVFVSSIPACNLRWRALRDRKRLRGAW